MNGSTKTRMRIREISAGGSHQRQDENSLERIGTVTIFDLSFSDLPLPLGEGRGEGRSYGRKIRSHYHHTLTLTLSQRERESTNPAEAFRLEPDRDCQEYYHWPALSLRRRQLVLCSDSETTAWPSTAQIRTVSRGTLCLSPAGIGGSLPCLWERSRSHRTVPAGYLS